MQEISQGIARRVSVSAYCLTLTQQVYHGEKMLIFNEIMNLKKKKNLTPNLIIFFLKSILILCIMKSVRAIEIYRHSL